MFFGHPTGEVNPITLGASVIGGMIGLTFVLQICYGNPEAITNFYASGVLEIVVAGNILPRLYKMKKGKEK